MTGLVVGQPLPPVTGTTPEGEISLESLKGQYVVLYFYPKDNTPGCTTEAHDFRDRYEDFIATGCQVIGVSRDTAKSHANFAQKHELPFPLIADTDENLCLMFDVIKMKNMYGRQVRGIVRSTFLIDRDGVLKQEWRGVRVPGHVDAVLQAIRQANAESVAT